MNSAGPESLPSKVRAARGNMHVRAAASEIGIGPTTLLKIEKGGLPSRPTLVKLARWLGESESGLLGPSQQRYMARHKVNFGHVRAQSVAGR